MKSFGRRLIRITAVLLIIAIGFLLLFRKRYNEPIRELSETQIMNATSDLINDAIDQQIEAGDIHYDRIVYFEKDLNGRITALKTNMSEVNRLKTCTLNIINDEILALDTSDIGVPLGSIFLPELFSGRGPIIPVQIISIRNSDASVLVLGQTASFTVTSEVVVAETIIVGDVPDTFFQTGGNYGSKTEN